MTPKAFKQVGERAYLKENPKNVLQGNYKGYNVLLQMMPNVGYSLIVAGVLPAEQENVEAVQSFLMAVRTLECVNSCGMENGVCRVFFKPGKESSTDTVLDCMDKVVNFLDGNGYQNGCVHCGSAGKHTTLCGANGAYQYMCDDCYNEAYGQQAQNTQKVKAKKNNVVAGLVGALLGALLGGILWVVIYQLGYIAGIAGFVMAICALKGYELLGGKPRKMEIIITIAIVAVMIVVAEIVAIAVMVCNEWGTPFFDTLSIIPELITEFDLVSDVVVEVLIGYVLTAVASFTTVKNMLQNTGEKVTIQKYE